MVNVRGLERAALVADPDFVYVGRAVRRGGGWPGSIWGNSHTSASCGGAAEAVRRFEQEIRGYSNRAIFLRSLLGELRGKTLGCWCCDWDGHGEPSKPCHAVVLARMADALTNA